MCSTRYSTAALVSVRPIYPWPPGTVCSPGSTTQGSAASPWGVEERDIVGGSAGRLHVRLQARRPAWSDRGGLNDVTCSLVAIVDQHEDLRCWVSTVTLLRMGWRRTPPSATGPLSGERLPGAWAATASAGLPPRKPLHLGAGSPSSRRSPPIATAAIPRSRASGKPCRALAESPAIVAATKSVASCA